LHWIACSPLQVTVREMEQVLLIHPRCESLPRVQASLNVLQLCGPLVEILDERLHFIHFTVKE
jgi:hypothetical protein